MNPWIREPIQMFPNYAVTNLLFCEDTEAFSIHCKLWLQWWSLCFSQVSVIPCDAFLWYWTEAGTHTYSILYCLNVCWRLDSWGDFWCQRSSIYDRPSSGSPLVKYRSLCTMTLRSTLTSFPLWSIQRWMLLKIYFNQS